MLGEEALIRCPRVDFQTLGSLAHWFPVTLQSDPPGVWWRFLGAARFTQPFFQDDLVAQAAPDRRACLTPWAALDELPASVPPTAFIFHLSRCGSTLLTQALAVLPQCIVMSEPPVLDAFFRFHQRHPERSGGEIALSQLIAALGQRRDPRERHFFVKFDSWHLPWVPFLRRAFPQTRFLFLYRDPRQVLASHRRQRGPQMVPGLLDMSSLDARMHGEVREPLAPGDLDGHTIRVIEHLLDAAGELAAAVNLMLVNYAQLPDAIWRDLLPAFGVDCTAGEVEAVRTRSRFHSKHASAQFEGDPKNAWPGAVDAPDQLAGALRHYERLERLRLGRL
jgi:hypothetical protein